VFIDDPTFCYWLVLGSLINYISGTVVFVPVYFRLKQENYRRNLRIVALGWYGANTSLSVLGLLVYKYFYHQALPLYLQLWTALSIVAISALLGLIYAGIGLDFFDRPRGLKATRVAGGLTISVLGLVLAVIAFL
jgi:hypothetical protein